MYILPRFNFLFQSLPCYLNKDFLKSINKLKSSFIWKNAPPRISFKTFFENGGQNLPDLQLCHWAALTKGMIIWLHEHSAAPWADIERDICFPSL